MAPKQAIGSCWATELPHSGTNWNYRPKYSGFLLTSRRRMTAEQSSAAINSPDLRIAEEYVMSSTGNDSAAITGLIKSLLYSPMVIDEAASMQLQSDDDKIHGLQDFCQWMPYSPSVPTLRRQQLHLQNDLSEWSAALCHPIK